MKTPEEILKQETKDLSGFAKLFYARHNAEVLEAIKRIQKEAYDEGYENGIIDYLNID